MQWTFLSLALSTHTQLGVLAMYLAMFSQSVVVWVLCIILSATVELPANAQSIRMDLKLNTLRNANWFRLPYPFQWGLPTFSVASAFGMLAGWSSYREYPAKRHQRRHHISASRNDNPNLKKVPGRTFKPILFVLD